MNNQNVKQLTDEELGRIRFDPAARAEIERRKHLSPFLRLAQQSKLRPKIFA